MFSGIIEEVGIIFAKGGNNLKIEAHEVSKGVKAGDSISVNGVCLTVTTVADNILFFEVMPETLKRSNLGVFAVGDKVNLERALRMGSRIGGHLVQGHIDATAKVLSRRIEMEVLLLELSAPSHLMRYIVDKGFVALDGASITVITASDRSFSVSMVNYTLKNTRFSTIKVGDTLNIEVDMNAKYIEKLLKVKGEGVTEALLKKHGFMVG